MALYHHNKKLSMWTASPATRSSLPRHQTLLSSFNSQSPRLCFLCRNNPANPFVAGKRCNIFPRSLHCGGGGELFAEVGGGGVHRNSIAYLLYPYYSFPYQLKIDFEFMFYRKTRHVHTFTSSELSACLSSSLLAWRGME